METLLRYRAEDFTATLPLSDYLARFRDAGRIAGYCRSCPRYGATWACPPFGFDVESLFEGCTTALIVATRITPIPAGAPLAAAREVIRPERLRLEERLERVRPSLEACGFDLERTASELFGIEMLWGRDGRLPEYLTLVCGLFHGHAADDVRW